MQCFQNFGGANAPRGCVPDPYLKILYPHMGPPTTPEPQVLHHLNPALHTHTQHWSIDWKWCSSGVLCYHNSNVRWWSWDVGRKLPNLS